MAKIVITIDDIDNGKVRVVANPPYSEMAQMALYNEKLTNAHAYAFKAINAIHELSKEQGESKIIIPKMRGM